MIRDKALLLILVSGFLVLLSFSGISQPKQKEIIQPNENGEISFHDHLENLKLILEKNEPSMEEFLQNKGEFAVLNELKKVKPQLQELQEKFGHLTLSDDNKKNWDLVLEALQAEGMLSGPENFVLIMTIMASFPDKKEIARFSFSGENMDFSLTRFNFSAIDPFYYRGYFLPPDEKVRDMDEYLFQISRIEGIEAKRIDENVIAIEYMGGTAQYGDGQVIKKSFIELNPPDFGYTIQLIDCSSPDYDCEPTGW